jgi:DNA-binding NarL/FixJ family response regulator
MVAVKIVVADDHEVVRTGVRSILEQQAGWQVVGEAEDGEQAIVQALHHLPHIVLMDCMMPKMNGVDATRQIRARCPRTEVLMFSMYNSEQMIREALLAGARGYLLKSDAKLKLLDAVEAVAARKAYFSPCVNELLLHNFTRQRVNGAENGSLSPRERQVVQLIAEGMSNKSIALHLEISLKTIETHRAAVMAKLHLGSAADLVRYAIRNNLIEP